MTTRITIQYLPGCPNLALAEQRVAEAIGRLGTPNPSVALEEIVDEDHARRAGFHSSPTVLLDGVDPFAEPGAAAVFSCRVYRTEKGSEGAPSVEQLTTALAADPGSGAGGLHGGYPSPRATGRPAGRHSGLPSARRRPLNPRARSRSTASGAITQHGPRQ